MLKSEIEMKLQECYKLFGTNPSDSIEMVRKMYTCLQSYASNYMLFSISKQEENIFEQECITGPDCNSCASVKREYLKVETLIRLAHDSYLAILLSRMDFEIYKNIIYGLLSYFICSDANVNFSLSTVLQKLETEEYAVTKEKYIEGLMKKQKGSTNAGHYLFTPSLGSIMEIEKNAIDKHAKVKCMSIKQPIPYGDLHIV